ncbi:MAG: TonB-dependent receptor [Elusimicrobiota bacterium]
MKKILFFILVIGIVLVKTAPGAEYIGDMGTMVVTPIGSKINSAYIPANIEVIDRDRISSSGNESVADVLRDVNGLRVSDWTGNGTKMSVDISGFGETASQNVLILVDGMRLDSNDLSGTDWQQVTADQIERVEIIKGPGTVIYGDNASGGVINIITESRIPRTKKMVEMWATSYNGLGGKAKLSGSQNSFSYSLAGSGSENPGYRQNSEIGVRSVSGDFGYQIAGLPLKLDINSGYKKISYGLPGSLSESELESGINRYDSTTPEDKEEDKNSYVRGKLSFRPVKNLNIELNSTYKTKKSTTVWVSMGSSTEYKNYRNIMGLKIIKNKLPMAPAARITAGFDYDRNKMNTEKIGFTNSISTIQVVSVAPYIHTEIPASEKLIFSGGIRYHNSGYNFAHRTGGVTTEEEYEREALAYSAGLSYLYRKMAKTYINYSQNFRFPKTGEFFSIFSGELNEDLKAQKSDDITAGLRIFPFSDFTAGLHYRHSYIEDELFYNPETGANENIEETFRRIYELKLSYKLGDRLSLSGGINHLVTEIKSGEYSGNKIPGVPHNKFNFSAKGQPVDNLTLRASITGTDDRYFISDFKNEASKLPGYVRTDLTAVYSLSPMSISLGINNLFNEKYSEHGTYYGEKNYYPSPVRNYTLEVGITY